MAEVALIPDSEMMGKTVREIAFRTRFGLNIVGMKRDGKAMDGSVVDEPLQLGDILLVVGNWRQIALLAKRGRDFVVLNMPVEVDARFAGAQPGSTRDFLSGADGSPDAHR